MSRHEIDLSGSRVLITGAARGIGALTAQRLSERGARVALLGIEPELLEQVATRCGGTWHRCDVSDREAVQDALAAAAARFGRLDVLVNNAMWTSRTATRSTKPSPPRLPSSAGSTS